MEIWLNNGNDKIRLPILPSSFTVESSQQNTSQNVHRKGEVNLLGKRNLKTIEISSFFPNHDYPFCQYHGFKKPYYYVKKIEGWKDSQGICDCKIFYTGKKNEHKNRKKG